MSDNGNIIHKYKGPSNDLDLDEKDMIVVFKHNKDIHIHHPIGDIESLMFYDMDSNLVRILATLTAKRILDNVN